MLMWQTPITAIASTEFKLIKSKVASYQFVYVVDVFNPIGDKIIPFKLSESHDATAWWNP